MTGAWIMRSERSSEYSAEQPSAWRQREHFGTVDGSPVSRQAAEMEYQLGAFLQVSVSEGLDAARDVEDLDREPAERMVRGRRSAAPMQIGSSSMNRFRAPSGRRGG